MAERNTNVELGRKHTKQRALLISRHIDGTDCWWCGEPMYLTQDLDADHTVTRSKGGTGLADRLMHSPCNRSRGDGSRDHLRPALDRMKGGCPRNVIDWGPAEVTA